MQETFIIDSRYKVSIKLGHGGNADVFLAFDTINEKNVAIKYLNNTISDETDLNYQKYKQEIITMAALNHPNIVKIFDTGVFLNKPYVVMEYVRGKSLRSYIQQQGCLLVDEVYFYLCQILDGLAICHNLGIVHRDIKPENMIVKPDGTLVLLDFGTSYHLNHDLNMYQEDRIIGTLCYMAPEYAENPYGTILVDIYAIGITMFEMFTGKLPFTHPTNDPKEIFRMHRRKPLPSMTTLNANVPASFETIVIKACAKKPVDRYQNVYEFKSALIEAYNEYKNPQVAAKKESFFKKIFLKKGKH